MTSSQEKKIDFSEELLKNDWNQIVKEVSKKRGSIGAQLSGCILGDLKGSNLDVISYDNSEFNQKLLKEGLELVKTIIDEKYGSNVNINLLIDTIVASLLVTGSISWLYFSDRLIELPLAVFGIAISIVMLPVLSKHFQKKESELYSSTLSKSIKLSMLIAIPSMAGLIILSSSIISSLFMYGNFDLLDLSLIHI